MTTITQTEYLVIFNTNQKIIQIPETIRNNFYHDFLAEKFVKVVDGDYNLLDNYKIHNGKITQMRILAIIFMTYQKVVLSRDLINDLYVALYKTADGKTPGDPQRQIRSFLNKNHIYGITQIFNEEDKKSLTYLYTPKSYDFIPTDKTERRNISSEDRMKLLVENPKCSICKNKSAVIDHIVPHSKGGESTIRNSIVLCEQCNTSKRDYSIYKIPCEILKRVNIIYNIIPNYKKKIMTSEDIEILKKIKNISSAIIANYEMDNAIPTLNQNS
jgi:hypothetical protein